MVIACAVLVRQEEGGHGIAAGAHGAAARKPQSKEIVIAPLLDGLGEHDALLASGHSVGDGHGGGQGEWRAMCNLPVKKMLAMRVRTCTVCIL